jgi:POT family proton-dependent oligopeptide transporter
MENTPQKGHPKGLYVLFITEMWERFSYYGMRALLVLFCTKALLFDKESASDGIYGSYTGLVYLTPLIGGYMADRYWGNRKSIVIGGLMMAIGQFFMFLSGSFYDQTGFATTLMFVGLGFLIFGNGFFKPNISTMVGQLYVPGDKRVDSAFTIFYMGINLGAFLAPLVCGMLGDTGNPADFKWGFLAACIGMTVSTALFVWLKNHYIVTPEGKAIGMPPEKVASKKVEVDGLLDADSEVIQKGFSTGMIATWLIVEVVLFFLFWLVLDQGIIGGFIFSLCIAAPGFIISDRTLSKVERSRIWVIYIIAFFVIFFWAAFEQAGASLTFFAEEQTNRVVNLSLSKTVYTIINLILASIVAYFTYRVFSKMKNEQKGVKELILILLLGALGYFVYAAFTSNGLFIDEAPAAWFQSVNAIASVLFAPLFSVLWTFLGKRNIEPSSPYKQSIGLFLLALGYLVIALGVKGVDPSTKVSMMWLISLYTIHTFGELCLSPIGLSMVNKLAPLKFASLLMGVWFLSTACANKFAGTLSAYYPATMVLVENVKEIEAESKTKLVATYETAEKIGNKEYISIDIVATGEIKDKEVKASIIKDVFEGSIIKEKSFLGYKIDSLYSFFMLFVFMAGAASVVLFILSSRLMKMMHGIK